MSPFPSPTRRGLLAGAGSLALGATILDTGALLGWDPAQAAPADGTLRVAMTAAAVPLSNGCPDQGAEGLRFMGITIYDQLVEWDLTQSDKAAPLKPGLATSWKTDPADPTVWHFEIRPGVKFHDGHVLTAEDVAFSFDRAFKTDAPWFDARASSQASLRVPSLLSWKVEGPMSFSLKTKIADSTIPFCLTWVGITHRGAWEAAGKSWDTYLQHAVGTGPWKLDTFSLRERATLSRFADHWDPARVPKAQNLVLLPVPEASTRIAALRSGQVNFVEAPAPDAVESLKAAGFQVLTNVYPHNWTWQLSMLEGSPFRDIRVRKALNLAIDRSGMKDLLNGLMLEGKGLMTPSSPWYGKPSFELKFDPAAAKALLAEAGFPPGKLNFKVAISSSGSGQMQPVPMNEFLQANLKDVGVNVEFQVMEWNTLLGVMRDGAKAPSAKGISAINVSYSGFDPYNGFFRLLKTSMQAPVGTNWGYYSDPQMDAIFDEAYKEMDPVKQSALLAQAHTKIVDDALFLFVAHDLNPRALAPNLHGFVEAQSWFQSLTPIAVG